MVFNKAGLQFLTIASVFGLSGHVISFNAYIHSLKDGTDVLSFDCSSTKHAELPYAEFLVNNKSAASSIYISESGECVFNNVETNCTKDVCQCSSDGQTFHWTFPMPFSKTKIVKFSCHMYLNSKTSYEQAHIYYNGTGFVHKTTDNEFLNASIETTTRFELISPDQVSSMIFKENNETQMEEINYSQMAPYIYITVISTLLVFAFGIALYCICNKLKNSKKEDTDEQLSTGTLPQIDSQTRETTQNVRGRYKIINESSPELEQLTKNTDDNVTDRPEFISKLANNEKTVQIEESSITVHDSHERESEYGSRHISTAKLNKTEELCPDCGENLCSCSNGRHCTCRTHGRTQRDHVCRNHAEILFTHV